ncbi:peptidoglycan-binding protein [Streptomyces fumanus]|uniref:peptidoglycan-binding protein n=1 Tax=Streptomyces fumanus TaxID=67302 RepID=UPI0033E0E6AD
MASVAEKLISLALGEVGYHEGRSASGSWNNHQKYSPAVPGLEWSQNQAWCQTFQSWLALKAGSAAYEPRTASCATAVAWFKKAGRFSFYPAIGAQVFYGPGGANHVGRVIKYDRNYIWTVEGNTNTNGSSQGDGVYQLKRERRAANTYGYGLPAFPEGVVTADPALKGKKGYTYKATASGIPAAKPAAKREPFPGAAFFMSGGKPAIGKSSPIFTAMGKRLIAKGFGRFYKVGAGPKLGQADVDAYEAYQRSLGYKGADATWPPGKASWDKLNVPKV